MLAIHNPRNLTNGIAIDTAEALSSYNKKQFHHIYPKAFLKSVETESETNSLVNICMLAASENNAISDESPHTYLPALVEKHSAQASTVFKSNFLPDPLTMDYSTLSYEDFLEKRAQLIHAEMTQLSNGDVH
jgi:hypothetical protein